NKTLAANFKATATLQMLEANYKTFCAANGKIVEDGFQVKDAVLAILDRLGYGESRAAKLDVHDFLKLLSAFHDASIHFC
ncbi:Dimethyladenosine transferase, partial [Coemansia helicoidea]